MTLRGRGILITNLGSPASPTPPAVKAYLEEFLMDPHVVTLPTPLRYLLVKAIARTRCHASAAAYAAIWTNSGGPLRDHAQQLAQKVRQATGLPVAVGMRYGEPSFAEAVNELREHCDDILVISAFPQYAKSTYASSVQCLQQVTHDISVHITAPYYADSAYIHAYRNLLAKHLASDVEHLLFSFHGIPEMHLRQTDESGAHCLRSKHCCDSAHPSHARCYRFQCLTTARLLGEGQAVPTSVSFQSRLGRAQWLQPYTVDRVKNLAQSGIKRLAVSCPAFISDNLETLFEIGHEARELFLDAGGERLDLIPCLNSSSAWVDRVVAWCRAPSESHVALTDA